ncbi:MAG: hypothetical protein UY48_C0006G0039 [Candidatus Gottesmanbacteria bacterium GW2011_GWB1_49_7]|uniref:Uncharacterized protein n=1 Tax=Candidatus Gottesmanbacteria bacterium GW2011_GWB1_49_7 TaxID=1618448 RepID=A0A0G1W2J6_9BACT|nr:MAG: hypothetical protein UY48_C0006G0039 [Candidatus Gottesmanbacteria bacterium GW2011_GWB1_49_7]
MSELHSYYVAILPNEDKKNVIGTVAEKLSDLPEYPGRRVWLLEGCCNVPQVGQNLLDTVGTATHHFHSYTPLNAR